ncbi:unnamed protein product, partial [Mesorhabditis spiculigera]
MAITWITHTPYANAKTKSYVSYSAIANNFNLKNDKSTVTTWNDHGGRNSTRHTHRVTLTGLEPGVRYYYKVGSDEGMSKPFNFTMIDPKKPIRAAIFGDLAQGQKGLSLEPLRYYSFTGRYNIMFHIGDIAYDMDQADGWIGDYFFKEFEDVASHIPYMTLAGNHEQSQNFNHYINRFTMPSNGKVNDNQFWSFDLGPVHFVGLSSEYHNYNMYDQAQKMVDWLKADLAKTKQPWIIAMIHRPMYCSARCDAFENNVLKKGANKLPAIEPILGEYGVDMLFAGHKHYYERLFPIYNDRATIYKDAAHIKDAKATIHFVSGSAGCHTHIDDVDYKPLPYSAHHSELYGFSYSTVTAWVDQGKQKSIRYTHRVILKDLEPDYRVGSSEGQSQLFNFTMLDGKNGFRAAVFGDLAQGADGRSDISYDLDSNDGKASNPWLISMLHRPMYCSAKCDKTENIVLRKGDANLPALEPFLGKFGVDLVFSGHRHYYERLFPIYDENPTVYKNGSYIENAKATVHFVTGSAGCHSHTKEADFKPAVFSAASSDSYGFNLVEVFNATHIHSQFIHEKSGKAHDDFWLVKAEGYRPYN